MRNTRIDVNDVTYEMLINDPELRSKLERQARRERSEAMHELLVAPAIRLFQSIPAEASESLIRRSVAVCLVLAAFLAAVAGA
jgi:hypothetical protein